MNKILIVGCGHMGSALLSAWSSKTNNQFFVIDPHQYKKINLKFKNKIKAVKDISNLNYKNFLSSIEVVIFAIKPQIAKDILKDISKYEFNKKVIFISIIAGKNISFFRNFFPNKDQFIRVMPNMPAMINEGMSCLVGSTKVTKKNKSLVNSLFQKVGETIWLKNEKDINKVTAISGSGPGYVFLFIDAFEKAALQLGLNHKITKDLVSQTLLGSINLFLLENKTAIELVNNIAIKGGTTEAGIKELNKNKILYKTFKKAIKSANKKATQLSK